MIQLAIDGVQADNSIPQAGAVYVFVRNGETRSQEAYFKASNTEEVDYFGWSVAVSGDTLAVGARQEASAATRIDSDQTDNNSLDAEAAFVFDFTAWTDLGGGTPGLSGVPQPTGTGSLTPGSQTTITVTDAHGSLALSTAWPAAVPPGTSIWFQVIIEDPLDAPRVDAVERTARDKPLMDGAWSAAANTPHVCQIGVSP